MSSSPRLRAKLSLIGDVSSGKTSLLYSFCKQKFLDQLDSTNTVFETYVTDINVDGLSVELILWDTSGQDYYERKRSLNYPETNAILMCYSIDNIDSFTNIALKWYDELREHFAKTPIILVANKKDLRHDSETLKQLKKLNERIISREQGENLAKKIGAYGFYECSAKHNEGVIDVFEGAAKAALNSIKSKNKVEKTCCLLL